MLIQAGPYPDEFLSMRNNWERMRARRHRRRSGQPMWEVSVFSEQSAIALQRTLFAYPTDALAEFHRLEQALRAGTRHPQDLVRGWRRLLTRVG